MALAEEIQNAKEESDDKINDMEMVMSQQVRPIAELEASEGKLHQEKDSWRRNMYNLRRKQRKHFRS